MTAEAANRFLNDHSRRERIRQELERVDAQLVAWHEYDADRALPLEYKRYPPVPEVPRETLRDLHRMLVEEFARAS